MCKQTDSLCVLSEFDGASRPEWKEKRKAPEGVELTEKEEKELKPIEKVRLVMTRNKDDEKELL